jgi:hypothetical protein
VESDAVYLIVIPVAGLAILSPDEALAYLLA